MDPVTVVIDDERELGGYQRARCHNLSCEIRDLGDEADLGNIVDATDCERLPELLSGRAGPCGSSS